MADSERHPFLQGLSKHRGAPPTVLVIFGASGDLTARKLIPARLQPELRQPASGRFPLVGFGRKSIPDDGVPGGDAQTRSRSSHEASFDPDGLGRGGRQHELCLGRIPLDETDISTLAEIHRRDRENKGREVHTIFYYFDASLRLRADHLERLGRERARVSKYARQGDHSDAFIIEKPFGHDLASARSSTPPPASLPGRSGVSHRSLPRQGDGAEHPGVRASPTRSSNRSGTAATSITYRSRRRGGRRRASRRLLRADAAACAT